MLRLQLIAPNPPSNCLPCPPFALPQRPAFSSVFTPDCAIYMLFCLRALLGQHCLAWSQVFPVSEPRALSRTSPASSDRCAGQLFYLRFWVRFRLWCVVRRQLMMFMHPPVPVPASFIPTHLPPPPLLPTRIPLPPFPIAFGCVPPPPHFFASQQSQRSRSPLPIQLPLTITPLKASNMRRHSSGSSAQSSSCAASTSSNSNSEAVSSQDSGRATGGLASSLSPMDEAGDALPMYEFEIPNSLVGLIIGIKGKTIKELSVRTDVRMLIRQHHTPEKVDTHQICQVRGKRDQINRCLQMLRRRFPPARFPELNLQPVLPPPLPNNLFDAVNAQPSWLTLPDGIPCEVVCSSVIDPGHFFLQQPTHPSYSSLSHLDMYMLRLYSQSQNGQIPELPKPCQNGLLCAAPVLGAWFRAVTVCYYADPDEVLVRFVDYGGYTRLPRSDLRQIRTDLMSLPFQATECYLAHVQPVDGTWQWGEAAMTHFQKLCMGKVINVTVVGYHVDDKVPMVELTVNDEDEKIVRLDRVLMDAGYAKAGDPSKLHKVQYAKRPNSISQTSHVAV